MCPTISDEASGKRPMEKEQKKKGDGGLSRQVAPSHGAPIHGFGEDENPDGHTRARARAPQDGGVDYANLFFALCSSSLPIFVFVSRLLASNQDVNWSTIFLFVTNFTCRRYSCRRKIIFLTLISLYFLFYPVDQFSFRAARIFFSFSDSLFHHRFSPLSLFCFC